jgi:hypothetical protein
MLVLVRAYDTDDEQEAETESEAEDADPEKRTGTYCEPVTESDQQFYDDEELESRLRSWTIADADSEDKALMDVPIAMSLKNTKESQKALKRPTLKRPTTKRRLIRYRIVFVSFFSFNKGHPRLHCSRRMIDFTDHRINE